MCTLCLSSGRRPQEEGGSGERHRADPGRVHRPPRRDRQGNPEAGGHGRHDDFLLEGRRLKSSVGKFMRLSVLGGSKMMCFVLSLKDEWEVRELGWVDLKLECPNIPVS